VYLAWPALSGHCYFGEGKQKVEGNLERDWNSQGSPRPYMFKKVAQDGCQEGEVLLGL
jgi:hypothetical protein